MESTIATSLEIGDETAGIYRMVKTWKPFEERQVIKNATYNLAPSGRTVQVDWERSRRKLGTTPNSEAESQHLVRKQQWTLGLKGQSILTCLRTPVPS